MKFGRKVDFDERSRNYGISAASAPLKSRWWAGGGFLDQGSEGACVGFSLAHFLVSSSKHHPVHYDMPVNREQWASLIYKQAQRIDPWPGGSYPGASPFYEGTSVLAGVKTLKQMGMVRSYRWGFGLQDCLAAVSLVGPVVLGINWHRGMMSTDRRGFIRPTGPVGGGHAIMVRGVSFKRKLVILHNSWGRGWGSRGEARLRFSDLDILLKQQGECCIPII